MAGELLVARGTAYRLRFGGGADGIERMAASLRGVAFAPHRHDTYAVGLTLAGVQAFRYRGSSWHCLPGRWHVLHPDETHDGGAGSEEGLDYRIIYLDPALVQDALGGRALPFVADPVLEPTPASRAVADWLADIDQPLDDVQAVEMTTAVVDMLTQHARPARSAALDLEAVRRVRELLVDDPVRRHRVAEFERVAGMDRWAVARQFRAAFGTSPTRFRTLRQLDVARRLIRAGVPLGEVAVAAGFADQSHLTRMFKRAFGLTPAVWAAGVSGASADRVGDGGHVGAAVTEFDGLAEQGVADVQQG
ncbi:AraC family transcriptional regulator [Saccharothrix variisporea]|uniref:AraC family transcriptional regulator n=1 Tax=Saccharothrix variisporea TaxID=543527 RepID=A0A495X4G8_9PSEU|nr:AraC family transcriptional regulator [Saccharothrix variisporea]RKT67523.1 AraC family transcriptional regulator [Saccharothrix variisporea]